MTAVACTCGPCTHTHTHTHAHTHTHTHAHTHTLKHKHTPTKFNQSGLIASHIQMCYKQRPVFVCGWLSSLRREPAVYISHVCPEHKHTPDHTHEDTQENCTVGTADCRVQGFKHVRKKKKRMGESERQRQIKAKKIKPLAASLAHRVHTEQNKEELEKAEL